MKETILTKGLWLSLQRGVMSKLSPEERERFMEALKVVASTVASLRGVEEARRVIGAVASPPPKGKGEIHFPDEELGLTAVFSVTLFNGSLSVGEFLRYQRGDTGGQQQ